MGSQNRSRLRVEQMEDRCTPGGLGPADGTFLGLDLSRDDPTTQSAEDRGGALNNLGQLYCSQERPTAEGYAGACADEVHDVLGLPQPPGGA
jgi:hypothetical protein